jgi:hypothetical protein
LAGKSTDDALHHTLVVTGAPEEAGAHEVMLAERSTDQHVAQKLGQRCPGAATSTQDGTASQTAQAERLNLV